MAVGASAKVGRASPPGGQAHGASIGGFFVESGCTSSVAELAEKSALALPASGLSPGRGSYPTFMDRPSGTNFVQTPMNHDAGILIAISTWDTREQAQEAQMVRGH